MDNLSESLKQIDELLKAADDVFDENRYRGREDYDIPEMLIDYNIERAFINTLVLLDKLNLSRTYEKVYDVFNKAREKGFRASQQGVDEPYLQWSAELYGYLQAIGNSYNIYPFSNLITKDIISILRATLYSITDKRIFDKLPASESEVHSRIEAVLKCVFPDLKHKPSINKPIKNFEPDTGLPSVRTLIEYKFISDQNDAKRVSDEVLADTRGYFSHDWERFIYVIYEEARVKPESKWVQMLKDCGVSSNTHIIVLQGEPISP